MGHRGVIVSSLEVFRLVTSRRGMGSQAISREPPIMRDLRTLKELPPRSGHEWLSTLEREAILVGIYWGLTQKRICTHWKLSASAVKRFRNELYEAPLSIFRLPVIIRVGNGIFQCRVCGEAKQRLSQAQRHLLSHFFAHEIARNIDLGDIPEVF